ncbi:MAG: tetratricopeptide repeat protein [Muribaculaceae bacterium]|nr:tetratricopeptide repeat protein [Muribaculaceae bacterium]
MQVIRKNSGIFLALVLTLVLTGLCACSTKKNTAMSRQWQAFNTRYNVYYNGKEHYNEQIKAMEQAYEDDYTRLLLTHPAEARADSKYPQPSGDFKRTIEKMQKAIQLHSIKKKPPKKSGSKKEKEFREREEFNPFLHNAWLTMGKAQYFSGDFLGAASTFLYISKHFKWLPQVTTEARLWQARCYCALDWDYEAENVLHLVKPKDLTNSNLKNLYNLTNASYYVRTDKYREAIPFLTDAAKTAHGSQKNRLYFLLGQLYENIGDKPKAYQAFKKAGSGASTAYRTKFNARIKRSEVFTGSNIKSEVNSLRSLTRYERNAEYLDQIYYAIGNLYLSRKDTAEAKANYILAVDKSTRNGIDKALAQLALGNIYFNEGDYVKAQPCFSGAVSQLNDAYPNFAVIKRRSDVLDELAVYAGNVQLQDSLLTLSKLPVAEQQKICQRLADELIEKEKKEAAEAARQEAMDKREQGNSPIDQQGAGNQGFQMNGDKSWYFYNTMTKNAGKTEFQRRWGARKLEDDWRRRNKTTFSLDPVEDDEPDSDIASDSIPADTVPGSADKAKKEADPHFMEYYFKQIPSTPEEIRTCNDIIQEGLYNEGLILKDKLEDFPAAEKIFLELNKRYPDNIYRLDVYYNLYLMDVRSNKPAEAERWRALIISEFPDSPYGQAMLDPDYFDKLRRMNRIQEEMYSEAYSAYLENHNSQVHKLTSEMEKDYPLSKILPKFVFIDALSYLTEGDNDKFRDRLDYLLQKWPDTDMTPMAGSILKGLKEGKVPHQGSSNSRGMLWDIRLTNDENAMGDDGQPANFERDPNKPQLLVLAFPRDSVSANQLLFDVARFNFSSFVVKDFDLEPMSFGNVGLLIIRGFSNMKELENYRNVMARSDFQLPEGVRPIMISKANFELLLREGRSFEEYFQFEEAAANEPPHGLPDSETPESPETPSDSETPNPENSTPDNPEVPTTPNLPTTPEIPEESPEE